VHVNLALVLKFLPAYAAAAAGGAVEYADVGVRLDPADDAYLFSQGAASGLSKIRFSDWRPSFARFAHLPNVDVFLGQLQAFARLMAEHGPNAEQAKDLDYLLSLGQIFTSIVYAQLAAEAAGLGLDGAGSGSGTDGTRSGTTAELSGLTEQHVDRMFAVFVQDIATYAVALHGQASASAEQREAARTLIAGPVADAGTEAALLDEVVGYAKL
jgi:acyl-CoA dehydrogenase